MWAAAVFPTKERVWRDAADLEVKHGTQESLEAVLQQAVGHCPRAESLWCVCVCVAALWWISLCVCDAYARLLGARVRGRAGDIDGARRILGEVS